MKKDSYIRSFLVLATMVIYLMITLSNIFFLAPISRLTDCPPADGKMIFKKHTNDATSADYIVYLTKRPDRSIVQNNNFVDLVKAAVALYILLFFVPYVFKLNFNNYSLRQLPGCGSLSTHLFFCTLRI